MNQESRSKNEELKIKNLIVIGGIICFVITRGEAPHLESLGCEAS